MGPAGFEPATSSLEGCSSTCIRNATTEDKRDKGRQDTAVAGCPAWGFEPRGADVALLRIRVKTDFTRVHAWRRTVGET